MPFDLRHCVVSIRHKNRHYQICGTGFVVDPRHILTCAHVVKAANAGPGETLPVVFALPRADGKNPYRAKGIVLADYWRDSKREDIAVLELTTPLPQGVTPARLAAAHNSQGHQFRAFGYAPLGEMKGLWASGEIVGEIHDADDVRWLQLRSQEGAQGLSGGPVLDTETDHVIGMFSRTATMETGHFRDSDFATPIDLVQDIWPGIKLSATSPQSSVLSPTSTCHFLKKTTSWGGKKI